jgi:predicted  nucleic acid-binding Zn-ribbon protein
VTELAPREQRRCQHSRWSFVVLRTANGVEQVREGCPDCGHRDLYSHPHRDHPRRDTYPVVQYGTGPRAIGAYDEYLRTEAWLERREAAKARAGWRCQLCGDENAPLECHHNTYRRIGAELETDLCVLCAPCHRSFHDRRALAEQRARAAA